MKTTRVRVLTVCLVAVSLLLLLSPSASAVDRYGVIGLTNQTDTTIHYRYRIGDNGSWHGGSIGPRVRQWFSHRYDRPDERRSPPFYLSFDSDLRGAKEFSIKYKLSRRAAVGQGFEYGKKYAFRYDGGDRRYIDLKAID